MEEIKVSVIIPVYNVEKYIKQCLESVINQTLKDIEIIVVNDGTKDNSMKIVEEYLSDKRIKIINKENGGLSSARNAGMREAQGKYIYFIDSDDFVDKEVLSTLYKNSENEKMDIVFSNFSYYNDRTKKEKRAKFIFPFKENINKGYYYLYNGEEINVWNRLYKKEFLKKYNFKFIEGIIYEDQDFGFKTIMLAEKIKYVENYGYKYRTDREGSIMSSQKKEKSIESVQTLKREMSKFFSNVNLNEFQKIRVYFKLLSLDFWEKELKGDNDFKNEILNLEKEIEKIYQKNKFNKTEKKIIIRIVRNLLKNKKINIFRKVYWKNGIINFRLLKSCLKGERK